MTYLNHFLQLSWLDIWASIAQCWTISQPIEPIAYQAKVESTDGGVSPGSAFSLSLGAAKVFPLVCFREVSPTAVFAGLGHLKLLHAQICKLFVRWGLVQFSPSNPMLFPKGAFPSKYGNCAASWIA
ncbi:MAG: hypothetical protein ACFBZ8_09560 [Opitutales bacterium]